MAPLHAATTKATADPAAKDVEPSRSPRFPAGVGLRLRARRAASVSLRPLLDSGEKLFADDRLMGRLRAPDPLLAGTQDGSASALVVATPDVVAGVLRIPQQRMKLAPAPGLREVVLVFAVAAGRGVAVEVAVQLLADGPQAHPALDVVLKDHHHDWRFDWIEDQPMLLAPFPGLLGIRVGVRLQREAIGGSPARVPALANGLLHARAAALDQVADIPLCDSLLHPPRENRSGAGVQRLIGGEQRHVIFF